jgi:plastocyanin
MDAGPRMSSRRVHAMANAAILASMLAGIAPAPVHAAPQEHVVVIEDMRFTPAQLTVQAGDRITWVNKDMVPHTASATQGGFDSQNIAAGASWTYTAGAAGSYTYACRYHPGMTATLVIR